MVAKAHDAGYDPILVVGEAQAIRPWASVSKLTVGIAAMRAVTSGDAFLDDLVGPPGATLAHLLSHASGFGFEASDPTVPVGTRRVYSNAGIDIASTYLSGGDHESWINDTVLAPLGVGARLRGRASADVSGTLEDMALVASELLVPRLLSHEANETMRTPFLPDLDGITPPFGRQRPNWWGLTPELKGTKQHWMGTWPSSSFGHFGRSGSLLLCDPTTNVFVVATSTEDFGPWAVALWPTWVDAMRAEALS